MSVIDFCRTFRKPQQHFSRGSEKYVEIHYVVPLRREPSQRFLEGAVRVLRSLLKPKLQGVHDVKDSLGSQFSS